MRNAFPILTACLLLAGCDRAPEAPRVTVEDAVVTLPAVPGRPGAAYFTLRTNEDQARLTGITSPRIGRIELHETMTSGNMSSMKPLREATFSSDAPLVFAPGGRHAMLFDIDPAVRVGDTVPLTFRLEPLPPVTIEAEVRGPGGAAQTGD